MIPLIDLATEADLADSIKKRVLKVIDSKSYILGQELENFEKEFAKFVGAKQAIGVGNGTDALRLALRANGVGLGDRVITVSFTSPFTSVAIMEEGAVPVYCDIDEKTWTMDPTAAESLIDKKVKAIMPVHIYGNPADMRQIIKIAKLHGLKIIEDACQAHGATIENRQVGNFSDAAAFSFYPTKNLGGFGDGGIVTTNNRNIAKKIRLLRHGGQTKRFWHVYKGTNSRLDEIQASILSEKLKRLKKYNKLRLNIVNNYISEFKDLPLTFQETVAGSSSANHLCVIRVANRNALHKFLKGRGITTDVYYPHPVHLQPSFRKFKKGSLGITEKLSKELLAIPLYPLMEAKHQEYVVQNIKKFFGK